MQSDGGGIGVYHNKEKMLEITRLEVITVINGFEYAVGKHGSGELKERIWVCPT